MNGRGVLSWLDGDSYVGEWKEGQRCGLGIMKSLYDGSSYDGEYKDDKRNGRGI